MATRRNFKPRVKARQEAATVRVAERAARGDAGQLSRLEQRGFGEGKEAKRLREKLGKAA